MWQFGHLKVTIVVYIEQLMLNSNNSGSFKLTLSTVWLRYSEHMYHNGRAYELGFFSRSFIETMFENLYCCILRERLFMPWINCPAWVSIPLKDTITWSFFELDTYPHCSVLVGFRNGIWAWFHNWTNMNEYELTKGLMEHWHCGLK